MTSRSMEERIQGFYDNSRNALGIKNVTMGEVENCAKLRDVINGRPLVQISDTYRVTASSTATTSHMISDMRTLIFAIFQSINFIITMREIGKTT